MVTGKSNLFMHFLVLTFFFNARISLTKHNTRGFQRIKLMCINQSRKDPPTPDNASQTSLTTTSPANAHAY